MNDELQNMRDFSEEQITKFLKEGRKNEAFNLLVRSYSEPLYWHIRKIVLSHDDTDDILQNVFIKVWNSLDEFRQDSKFYTWLHRISTNESLNFLNEKKRKVFGNSVEISDILENTLKSSDVFDGEEIEIALQKAILTLSERQRLIFNMRYFEEMTNEETASELGVAVGTIKATYHQAVKKIEEILNI